MAFWEAELGKSQWFAGNEFTAADIQMEFSAGSRGGSRRPRAGAAKAMAFLDRIHAGPVCACARKGQLLVGR